MDIPEYKHDGGVEHGGCIPYNGEKLPEVIPPLIEKARDEMGAGKTVEIRVSYQKDKIAWYANSFILEAEPHRVDDLLYCEEAGFYYCGRYRT